MTMRTCEMADRLSRLANRVYAREGCPGAYVRLTPEGYELHEPSPNAFPTTFRTAKQCHKAIRKFIGSGQD
jgi:hypothetical protein